MEQSQLPAPPVLPSPETIKALLTHNPLTIDGSLAFLGKGLFFVWFIMTLVFLYHWWKYTPSKFVALRATIIYLVGSLFLNALIGVLLA
jgi:hypothetical protein